MKKFSSIVLLVVSAARAQTSPLTLEQAIQEALGRNLDLQAERLGLSVAEARQITAALRPNPVLTFEGQTLNLTGVRFGPDSPLGPNAFNAHADYVIERGNKRQERMNFAAEDKRLAELQIKELVRRLVLEVQSGFVDVQQSRAALALAEQNLKSLQGIVEVNENRVRTGDLAPVELDRSRVAAIQYETAVEQARLNLDQAKTRLQRSLGRTAAVPDFDVTGDLRRTGTVGSLEELTQRAIERRPDLAVTRQAIARSRSDLKLQIANGKVDYTVGTEYTYQRAFGIGGSTLGFSFSMPLPVYNKNQGEIARAQREGRQYETRTTALEAAIRNETELAWRQYKTAERLLGNIEANLLDRVRRVREVTEYSYRRGEATLVEFLDAQRAYNDAIQSHTEARASFARSLYVIDAVTAADLPANENNNEKKP